MALSKKKAKRKFTNRKFTWLICGGVLAYMIFSFSQGFYEAYLLQQEIEILEVQLTEVRKENTKLQQELDHVQTPEAIEKTAREKLGLIKPGEVVIMKARSAQ
ncbi:MAG: FtsB family cell division protein [Peptococcales bacterium]|jgi:cell division protein FtsL